ncbi:MAG: GDP-mannose 4,6-dehydratase, partial [Halobacteriales archaeon]|nr:GDP-mannose 4,6-dehydratase [Halobacteriales archaeon]
NGNPPVVYGDGTQTRDFTYIDDIVRVNADLLWTDAADGEILNVGSGDRITIEELAEVVRDRLAPDTDLDYADRPAGDAEHTHADVSKAHDLLEYEPSVDIRTGVNRFIDWYLKNREWYEPLVLKS